MAESDVPTTRRLLMRTEIPVRQAGLAEIPPVNAGHGSCLRYYPEHLAASSSPGTTTHRRDHGDTAQGARLPGEIPPIKVTSAATASAAYTAAGKCGGAGSS